MSSENIDREEAFDTIDFDRILSVIRRQWRVVAVAAGIGLILGTVYGFTAVPLFTSTTSLLIDPGNRKIVDELSAVSGVVESESSILSQVELLYSEKIARSVVDKLNLIDDPVFNADTRSFPSKIFDWAKSIANFTRWFSSSDGEFDIELEKRYAADGVVSGLDVFRVGKTNVLTISYTSIDPNLSAKIANGVAEAYLTDQLDSKYEATRRASEWLLARIAELRQKSLETDLAVQKFKKDNGLIETGGQLITDQQLSQLNSQLIVAQTEAANAEAKYNRIKSIIDSGQTDAIVTEALDNPVINNFRGKFLDASKTEADISNRLGPNHEQAVRLRGEMQEYKRLMFEELGRIAESYQSTFQVSQSRLKDIESKVAQATGISATANDSQVQLRELEREAETYKNLYQTFLQRYQEAVQQQSFPVTEARIISNGAPPDRPSFPKKSLVMALAAVLGAGFGTLVGAFREYRDRFFRTGDQIRTELDLEFIGLAPNALKEGDSGLIAPPKKGHPRKIFKTNTVTNFVIDNPLSSFAETIRGAKIAVDLATGKKQPKIIGMVSVLPGEGKSTLSVNFAELLSRQGAKTLLIDCDLRNPGTTRAIAQSAERGLLEALLDRVPIQDLLLLNTTTRLAFMPAVIKHRVPHSAELLASADMDHVLEQAARIFDYIILDLPPIAPVVDARAISAKVDTFLLVIEWGRTARKVVRTALQRDDVIRRKCAGVILNKVDTEKMKLYQAYGSSEYYSSRYASYYRDNSA